MEASHMSLYSCRILIFEISLGMVLDYISAFPITLNTELLDARDSSAI